LRRLLSEFRNFDATGKVLVYSTTTPLPTEVLAVAHEFNCEHYALWCRYPDYLQLVGACRVNLTDSFHGAVFSLQAGVNAICLQADMRSWKLQGLRGVHGERLDIFPGLDAGSATSDLAQEIFRVLHSPEYREKQLQRQAAILTAGQHSAEEAWRFVRKTLGLI
jgi:hypothetical protein